MTATVRARAGVPSYTATSFAPRTTDGVLVIPVLDEAGRIEPQLAELQASNPGIDVVLADGGSVDGSTDHDLLRSLGVTTLLVKTSPGRLSTQLRMGFDYALRTGAEFVVTMDGNGKDGVGAVTDLVAALRAGADFVQGSRFVEGGIAENTPWSRLLAIRLVHAPLTSLAARRHYTDSTNGFRGHSRGLLTDPRVAPFRECFVGYELLAYLPIRAARLGLVTCEVPVARRYPTTGAVPTKIHGTQANLRLLRILLDAALGRFDPDDSEIRAAGDETWPALDQPDTDDDG